MAGDALAVWQRGESNVSSGMFRFLINFEILHAKFCLQLRKDKQLQLPFPVGGFSTLPQHIHH